MISQQIPTTNLTNLTRIIKPMQQNNIANEQQNEQQNPTITTKDLGQNLCTFKTQLFNSLKTDKDKKAFILLITQLSQLPATTDEVINNGLENQIQLKQSITIATHLLSKVPTSSTQLRTTLKNIISVLRALQHIKNGENSETTYKNLEIELQKNETHKDISLLGKVMLFIGGATGVTMLGGGMVYMISESTFSVVLAATKIIASCTIALLSGPIGWGISAAIVIFMTVFAVYNYYKNQNEYNSSIYELKDKLPSVVVNIASNHNNDQESSIQFENFLNTAITNYCNSFITPGNVTSGTQALLYLANNTQTKNTIIKSILYSMQNVESVNYTDADYKSVMSLHNAGDFIETIKSQKEDIIKKVEDISFDLNNNAENNTEHNTHKITIINITNDINRDFQNSDSEIKDKLNNALDKVDRTAEDKILLCLTSQTTLINGATKFFNKATMEIGCMIAGREHREWCNNITITKKNDDTYTVTRKIEWENLSAKYNPINATKQYGSVINATTQYGSFITTDTFQVTIDPSDNNRLTFKLSGFDIEQIDIAQTTITRHEQIIKELQNTEIGSEAYNSLIQEQDIMFNILSTEQQVILLEKLLEEAPTLSLKAKIYLVNKITHLIYNDTTYSYEETQRLQNILNTFYQGLTNNNKIELLKCISRQAQIHFISIGITTTKSECNDQEFCIKINEYATNLLKNKDELVKPIIIDESNSERNYGWFKNNTGIDLSTAEITEQAIKSLLNTAEFNILQNHSIGMASQEIGGQYLTQINTAQRTVNIEKYNDGDEEYNATITTICDIQSNNDNTNSIIIQEKYKIDVTTGRSICVEQYDFEAIPKVW